MPSSTGYVMTPAGVFTTESGVPAAGPASFETLWAYAHYDFAIQGGAIGPISLLGTSGRIPAKSLIIAGYLRVTTILGGGASATAALSVVGAGDLQAAAAFGAAPWSTIGTKALSPVWTAASAIFAATAADITLTVAANALNAGVFDVYLAYIPLLA